MALKVDVREKEMEMETLEKTASKGNLWLMAGTRASFALSVIVRV